MTSYRPQHRFYASKLAEENRLHSLRNGCGSSVHRPTPIYLAPGPLRVLQEDWALEAQMTPNTLPSQASKEMVEKGDVCLRDKTSEIKDKRQDGGHQRFKEIGSRHLSAFSSKRKETVQSSRNDERMSGLQTEAVDEKLRGDKQRYQVTPGALNPDDKDDKNTWNNECNEECFNAKFKIKEEPLNSPIDSEPNSVDKDPVHQQEEFSFRVYGTDHALLLPQIPSEVPTYAEHRSFSSSVQTTDNSAGARSLNFNQDPSSTKFQSSGKDSSVEGNQQQKPKHICDECERSFTRSSTLVTHKRIHSGDKPFSCEVCGRAFRQPGNLSRHRLTHTTTKPYVCPHCNKAFNRASNLHTHMRTHSDYKPYACDFCDKRFHQKVDMKIHRYTHTGEKPHKCSKCGRGFKQLTHLTYHMRTHSDVRMYQCEFCGKGFNQKGNLQAHRYRHTGERPFKCNVCGKGFTLASTRNTHLRTHADKKPFECQYCGKAFYQKNALKTHYIASHPYSGGVLIL
ncbi:zinc finger protein 37-like [Actinia tenebrosa]|uniref:Zinc finger protein 37-like n=1 Tax=Actinia tenebrosa TaxID=6105 RepID=A0A6P8H952_ACTTE|nr:zinc finger protein 37-like [Actinia tenebrosa]